MTNTVCTLTNETAVQKITSLRRIVGERKHIPSLVLGAENMAHVPLCDYILFQHLIADTL